MRLDPYESQCVLTMHGKQTLGLFQAASSVVKKISMLKSALVRDFRTWNLISWQHFRNTIQLEAMLETLC